MIVISSIAIALSTLARWEAGLVEMVMGLVLVLVLVLVLLVEMNTGGHGRTVSLLLGDNSSAV